MCTWELKSEGATQHRHLQMIKAMAKNKSDHFPLFPSSKSQCTFGFQCEKSQLLTQNHFWG